jgi:hypothetical protein
MVMFLEGQRVIESMEYKLELDVLKNFKG